MGEEGLFWLRIEFLTRLIVKENVSGIGSISVKLFHTEHTESSLSIFQTERKLDSIYQKSQD